MAENKTRAITTDNEGVVAGWVTAGTDVAEKSTETFFATLQDVRGEINRRVLSTIDFVDNLQQGGIKLARTVTGRVDQLVQETIRAAEQSSMTLVSTARETGHDAAEMVSRSVSSLTSRREATRKAA